MKIVRGKSILDIEAEDILAKAKVFDKVLIDIGTGEGEYPYRVARDNQSHLCIGLDSEPKMMIGYSHKSTLKKHKGGLDNLIYLNSNIATTKLDLKEFADELTVLFPWGSLRDSLIKGDDMLLDNLRSIMKPRAKLHVCVSYSEDIETKEFRSRELPSLGVSYIKNELSRKYKDFGILIKNVKEISNLEVKEYSTKWAKKLAYGRSRLFYAYDSIRA